ncbi:MAG TPA: hypothetical protein VM659_11825 [Dongiaceae bacterium]|nr:hypothetical protein [Dongiaceae bacterium]
MLHDRTLSSAVNKLIYQVGQISSLEIQNFMRFATALRADIAEMSNRLSPNDKPTDAQRQLAKLDQHVKAGLAISQSVEKLMVQLVQQLLLSTSLPEADRERMAKQVAKLTESSLGRNVIPMFVDHADATMIYKGVEKSVLRVEELINELRSLTSTAANQATCLLKENDMAVSMFYIRPWLHEELVSRSAAFDSEVIG